MKSNVKRFLTFIIVLIASGYACLIPTNTSFNAYSTISTNYLLNDNIATFSAGNGKYFFVSCNKSSSRSLISCFDVNTKTFIDYIDIPYLYDACCCNGNSLYIVKNDTASKNINIKEYFLSEGKQFVSGEKMKLSNKNLLNEYSFSADANGNFYFINASDNSFINGVAADGSGYFKIGEGAGPFISIRSNSSACGLYAVTLSSELMSFDLQDNNKGSTISMVELNSSDYRFINDNTIFTCFGRVYKIDNENKECSLLFSTEKNIDNFMACELEGYILTAQGNNKLNLYNTENKVYAQTEINGTIISLCGDGSSAIAITYMEGVKYIKVVTVEEFTIIENDIPSNPEQKPDTEEKNELKVTSNVYGINTDDFTISDVTIGTTIANFKDNIDYTGYGLSFKNYTGKPLASGKLGTGATVTFLKDEVPQFTFTFIVKGDLTGEGNANSRDISLMINYLLGESSLDGVYLKAADINSDGVVDTVDLLLLEKIANNS